MSRRALLRAGTGDRNGPRGVAWRRLLFHTGTGLDGVAATANRDPNNQVVGGINAVGGAANGVTENATESRIAVADVAANDWSRAVQAAAWFWPALGHDGAALDDATSWAPEYRVQFVTHTEGVGLAVAVGTTNSLTMAGVHSEMGIFRKAGAAFGVNRLGHQAGIAEGGAFVEAIHYMYADEIHGRGRLLHVHVDACGANKQQVAGPPHGKSGNTVNSARTGALWHYLAIGRFGNSDGLTYNVGVVVHAKTPILAAAA